MLSAVACYPARRFPSMPPLAQSSSNARPVFPTTPPTPPRRNNGPSAPDPRLRTLKLPLLDYLGVGGCGFHVSDKRWMLWRLLSVVACRAYAPTVCLLCHLFTLHV